jgi:hypothetical protein
LSLFVTVAVIGRTFSEPAMHANQTHPHYALSWVGGLMDPVFLRHAVHDAEGERDTENHAPASTWLDWKRTASGVAAFFRRRSSGP